jgi:hypothetical protein
MQLSWVIEIKLGIMLMRGLAKDQLEVILGAIC